MKVVEKVVTFIHELYSLQNVTDIAEEVQKLEEARDELDDDEEDGDDPEDSDYDPEDDRPAAKKSKIQTIEVGS